MPEAVVQLNPLVQILPRKGISTTISIQFQSIKNEINIVQFSVPDFLCKMVRQ